LLSRKYTPLFQGKRSVGPLRLPVELVETVSVALPTMIQA